MSAQGPASMRDRFYDVTTELLDEDPRLALVLSDIGVSRLAAAAARHPSRVVNVGIREALQVGVGAGLALTGFRPILHSYAPFLVERAFEQLKISLSHQDAGAVLATVAASYDAAHEGRTHQAPGDVSLLLTLPGWTIHLPGHADELDALLRGAAREEGCVYLRLSELSNRRPLADPGRLTRLREGSGLTVVVVGPLLEAALEATEGLDVTVLYTATVRPFDADGLQRLRRGVDLVLVEPTLAGTSAATVTAALEGARHRLLCLGVSDPDLRAYGSPGDHAAAHGLDPHGLRERITAFLAAAPTASD